MRMVRIGVSSRAITCARRDNEYDDEGSSSNRAEAPPNGSLPRIRYDMPIRRFHI